MSALPSKQPATPQAEAQLTIPSNAPANDTITVTFTLAAGPQPSPSPGPTSSKSHTTSPSTGSSKGGAGGTGGSGGTTSGVGVAGSTYSLGSSLPIGSLPLVNAGIPGISTTIPAGSASNLFPQISPSAVPSPAPGTQANPTRQTEPVAASSTIPLSLGSSEFGAQILGLIVLLLGVAIAVTRISLRKGRAGKPGASQ